MDMVYKFREGSRLRGSPQVVGEKLAEIRARRGRLAAPDVVEEATPKESPLHGHFEWDQAAAASQYRLEQARYLIAAVVIVKAEDEATKPIRAWCRVSEGGYEAVEIVMATPDLRERVLKDIRGEIKRCREKAEVFEGFASVLESLDRVDAIVGKKLEEVHQASTAVPG